VRTDEEDVEIVEDLLDEFPIIRVPALAHVHNLRVRPRDRELYIQGPIDDETGSRFVRSLRWLESLGAPGAPVRVVLETPGGDEDSMFSIHDAIRATACPVEVLAHGAVCSAGVLILACGDRRLVTQSTALMSHESRGEEGELGFRASRDRMKYREWQHRFWCELMARYTPRDARWWLQKTERQAEYWLLGGEAIVAEGLADAVVDRWPTGRPAPFEKRAERRPEPAAAEPAE